MPQPHTDRSRIARGRWGEDQAARLLIREGFEILDRNWVHRGEDICGEIDIVARRASTVVICEVKTRRSTRYGGGAAAVTAAKQQRLRKMAMSWMRAHGFPDVDLRFDVIEITGVSVTHHEAAF